VEMNDPRGHGQGPLQDYAYVTVTYVTVG